MPPARCSPRRRCRHDVERAVAALLGGLERGIGVRHLEGHRPAAARRERVVGLRRRVGGEAHREPQRDRAGAPLARVVAQLDPQRARRAGGQRRDRLGERVEALEARPRRPGAELGDLGQRLEGAPHRRDDPQHVPRRPLAAARPQRGADAHPPVDARAAGHGEADGGRRLAARPQPAERDPPRAAPAGRQPQPRDGRPEPPRAAGVDGERDPAARDHVEAAGGEEELGAHRQAAGPLAQRALEHRVAARVGRRVGDTRGELRELVAVELRRVRGRVLEHRPALRGVLALRLDLDLRPRPARQAAPARPHAEHLVGGLGGPEATRAVATRRPLALGAVSEQAPDPPRPQPLARDLVAERARVRRRLVGLDGEARRDLVMAVVARRRRRVHRHDHVRARLAHDADDPLERRAVVPHLVRQRRGHRVVEVDLVEVEDAADVRATDRSPLLVLADQAERRALLRADRVAAALAARDREDAGLDRALLRPRAVGGDAAGLVVGVRADEQHVEVRPARLGRRRQPARAGGERRERHRRHCE